MWDHNILSSKWKYNQPWEALCYWDTGCLSRVTGILGRSICRELDAFQHQIRPHVYASILPSPMSTLLWPQSLKPSCWWHTHAPCPGDFALFPYLPLHVSQYFLYFPLNFTIIFHYFPWYIGCLYISGYFLTALQPTSVVILDSSSPPHPPSAEHQPPRSVFDKQSMIHKSCGSELLK